MGPAHVSAFTNRRTIANDGQIDEPQSDIRQVKHEPQRAAWGTSQGTGGGAKLNPNTTSCDQPPLMNALANAPAPMGILSRSQFTTLPRFPKKVPPRDDEAGHSEMSSALHGDILV
eukprot:CAMPEP_0174350038 /NCGR_PEP_ID=MMETSP0811_2-20130205/6973_1 /TAXON_ID=73025 ORGANISM="Eutreptiella gymnastica-like, Strain CCMP1594" /NCGR_SAMPLE_ID=MMETSP0811_2 /ASSEMBLY_ACC=CAM_ASM_000667 /LENGTH=115 /DNA_ID=CAMNT_0015477959 /DNA_START=1401 /DNA_END=1750 /DNA_ORIENTATION=+